MSVTTLPAFLGRHPNAMGKKLLWLLLIAILAFLVGWFIYRRMARVSSPPPPVVSRWPPSGNPEPALPASPPAPAPNTATPPEIKKEAPVQPGFVLRQGETLDYDANITKLNSTVAHLKISAVEKRNSSPGNGVWHLQAFAHTENPYRMVFELDDQFDSYSDAGNMTSVQYEMHLSERGQKVESVQRLLTSVEAPIPSVGSAVRVPPGTRDPLGMLEYLRGVDWSHTPEVRTPAFDGRKLYDVRAAYLGKAAGIQVPAGTFNTSKIEIHVFDNGQEMKDAHFLLYLTGDSTRLPVLMEAVLPVATARVELTKPNSQ